MARDPGGFPLWRPITELDEFGSPGALAFSSRAIPNEHGILGYFFRNCLFFSRAVFRSTIFMLTSVNAVCVQVFEEFSLLVGPLAIRVIMMLLVDVVVEARAEEVLNLLTHLIRWRWISRKCGRGWQGHRCCNITRLAALMSAATSSTLSTSSTTSLLQPK